VHCPPTHSRFVEVLEWVQDLDKEIMEEQCLALFASDSYAIITKKCKRAKRAVFRFVDKWKSFFHVRGKHVLFYIEGLFYKGRINK
jgi:hypothetical protein